MTNQFTELSSRQIFDKSPKKAFTFGLSRHSKSPLSITTGFNSSTKLPIERFLFLRSLCGNDHLFRSVQLTSDNPKMSRSNFQFRSLLDFLLPIFPIGSNLMSFFKLSTFCFFPDLDHFIRNLLNFYSSVESSWTRSDKNAFKLDTSLYSNIDFFNFTFSIFSNQSVNFDNFKPEANSSFVNTLKYDFYI